MHDIFIVRIEAGTIDFYNVLCSVDTQLYIGTVIYIHSDRIVAACFDRKRSSSAQ